jgi:hypothetical protein
MEFNSTNTIMLARLMLTKYLLDTDKNLEECTLRQRMVILSYTREFALYGSTYFTRPRHEQLRLAVALAHKALFYLAVGRTPCKGQAPQVDLVIGDMPPLAADVQAHLTEELRAFFKHHDFLMPYKLSYSDIRFSIPMPTELRKYYQHVCTKTTSLEAHANA